MVLNLNSPYSWNFSIRLRRSRGRFLTVEDTEEIDHVLITDTPQEGAVTIVVFLEPEVGQLSSHPSNVGRISQAISWTSEQMDLFGNLCQVVLTGLNCAVLLQVTNSTIVVSLEHSLSDQLFPMFHVLNTCTSGVMTNHHIHSSVVVNLGVSISNGTKESSAEFAEITAERFEDGMLQPVVSKDFMDTESVEEPVNVVVSQSG